MAEGKLIPLGPEVYFRKMSWDWELNGTATCLPPDFHLSFIPLLQRHHH